LTAKESIEEIENKVKANAGEYDKVKPIEHPVQDLID
jgi:hypothetical protein